MVASCKIAMTKFTELDMRDDFEYQVYVTDTLHYLDKDDIESTRYVDLNEQYPGVIKKNGDKIILELSNSFKKRGNSQIVTNGDDKVASEKDLATLYATSWDGATQFTINKYTRVAGRDHHGYNAVSYGELATYQIRDMSISSQFKLAEKVYQATFSLDYIQEWFSIYSPTMESSKQGESLLNVTNLNYLGERFDLSLVYGVRVLTKIDEVKKIARSSIVIKFENPQSKDYVFLLGMQLRNFFQFMLRKRLGLYKIVLNKNSSWDGNKVVLKDERENWFIAQSFLPEEPDKRLHNFEISYSDIKDGFESILRYYLSNEKMQDFVERFLVISQYEMPVTPALLTLSSAVESYLNMATFSNGKPVKDFIKKLNMVFNGSWEESDSTKDLIKTIKDNRDYYIHGDKPEHKLSETELVPAINEFIVAIRNYLTNEIKNYKGEKQTTEAS